MLYDDCKNRIEAAKRMLELTNNSIRTHPPKMRRLHATAVNLIPSVTSSSLARASSPWFSMMHQPHILSFAFDRSPLQSLFSTSRSRIQPSMALPPPQSSTSQDLETASSLASSDPAKAEDLYRGILSRKAGKLSEQIDLPDGGISFPRRVYHCEEPCRRC